MSRSDEVDGFDEVDEIDEVDGIDGEPVEAPPAAGDVGREPRGFLPVDPERRGAESVLARLLAPAGVIGIGTALAAILVANDVAGWITGLVVAATSVVLSADLWRSRRL